MSNHQHTINIFKRMYRNLPPLVPQEVEQNMEDALNQVENNMSLDKKEVEDILANYAKKIWPFRKAFHEFVDIYEGKVGEKIFLRKMPREFKLDYQNFLQQGHSFRDIYTGQKADFFSVEERTNIHKALAETRNDIKRHVRQLVVSSDKKEYVKKIKEFKRVLDRIEEKLETLRELAENEYQHPELVAEIKRQIRSFEHSLAGLGSEIDHERVFNSEEFFEGRKKIKEILDFN